MLKKVGYVMFRKYRILDFGDLRDEVFGYLSEFAASTNEQYLEQFLIGSDLESEIADEIRALIQGHEHYQQVEQYNDGDSIELTVKVLRDDFDSIQIDEDGTMHVGVRIEFQLVDEDIEDVDCNAYYKFNVLIKGVK